MGFFDSLGIGDLIGAGTKIAGGVMSQDSAEKIARENIANQRDFAQHGVSWKVADARSAGISPLAALGASTSSFSNVVGSDALGQGIADAGQDIGKAVKAQASHEEKELLRAGAKLDIEGKQLDNDIKRAELASKIAKEGPATPPFPGINVPDHNVVDGQANSNVFSSGSKPLDYYGNKLTRQVLGGRGFQPDARWSDSAVNQNRHGDTIQDIVAPFILDADMKKNLGQYIPEFLWKFFDDNTQQPGNWMWRNRWSVLDAINKSLGGRGYYSSPRAERER